LDRQDRETVGRKTMRETLSAKDIERAEFSTSLRGYDREEVDAFLRTVAGDHRRLSEALEASRRTADKPYHKLGADMGELLQHARDSADQLTRRAEEEAKQSRQDAKKQASATREKAEREAGEIKQAAEYEASMRVKEADRRVGELLSAEGDARRRLRDIQAEIRNVMERMQRAEASLGGEPAAQEPSSAEGSTDQEAPTEEAPTEAELVPVDTESAQVEGAAPVDRNGANGTPAAEGEPAEEAKPERSPAA
jgi:DivIVA domain-containing protein